MRKVYTDEQRQRAKELLARGYSPKSVAQEVEIQYATVILIRKELGITGDANAIDWSDAATYFENGVALKLDKAIAAAKGCSVGSVYQYRRKNGIKAARRSKNTDKDRLHILQEAALQTIDAYDGYSCISATSDLARSMEALRTVLQTK